MIDTHCHLYSNEFSHDLEIVLQNAAGKGISRFYMPAIDSSTSEAMIEIEKKHPGKCFAMMGLHPCSVKTNYVEELEHVSEWLSKRSFSAIGEIGLDLYWDKSFLTEQYISFRKQCEMALQYELPIVIHSRNATPETIEVIREFSGKGLQGIFHCFGGSLEEAKAITKEGFYLGIGGIITYKNSGLAEVISEIDLAHLVLETDAPYLAPVPFRGKRNESSYLELIALKVAECKKIPVADVIDRTTSNALHIFKSAKS